ncbi:MAG: DUF6212 domain-containing protein [Pseudomonadota bacterium]
MTDAAQPLVILGDGLATTSVAGFAVTRLAAWQAELMAAGQNRRPVLRGPRPMGLIATPDEADHVTADPALSELLTTLGIPTVTLSPEASEAEVTAHAIGLLAASLARAEEAAAEERAAAAALRTQHRDMQARFSQVEEFVYHSLAPKYIRTEEFPLADAGLPLAAGSSPIRQKLPFSTRCLAAVDLYVREVPEDPGTLTLTLVRDIGPDLSPPVSLPLAGLSPGWIRFVLPRVLEGAPEDVWAEIRYDGPDAIALGLSYPSPVEEYRVRSPGGTDAAALALKGYRGLPGAPLPPPHMPRQVPAAGSTEMVSVGDLSPVRKLPVHHRWEQFGGYPDFTAVEYWTGENAILIHPSTHGPVCGIVRNIAARALSELRVSAHVGHRQSGPIAFAVGVAPAGRVQRLTQALDWLGHWIELQAGQFGVPWVLPARPIRGSFDLLLATSMEGRRSNRLAWGLFRDVTMTNGA